MRFRRRGRRRGRFSRGRRRRSFRRMRIGHRMG